MSKNDSPIVIKRETMNVILIVLLLVIVGLVVLLLGKDSWFGEKTPEAPTSSPTGGTLDVDDGAVDWNGQQLPDTTPSAPSAGIKIPGYPSITLPKNQETVNVALINPEGNPCYFTFELVLKDTGESLYKSKLVPPGKAITQITMSKALSAGEYDATIKITTTSLEDGSAMNGANVETVLIVK